MPRADLNIISLSNKERSVNFDARRMVNLFPVRGLQFSRGQIAAFPTPGLSLAFTVAGGAVARGCIESKGVGYLVVDGTFYTVASDLTVTSRGSLLTTSGRVSMDCSTNQVLIIDGTYGYIYTIATGIVARITDIDFPSSPRTVTYQDGYFLVNTATTIHASDLLDGSSWGALSFGSAEGDEDEIEAVISDHREVFVFGQKTTEVLYNAGTTPYAFARQSGVFNQSGCAARFSVAKGDNTIIYLANGEQGSCLVVRLAGRYTPEVISTPAVSNAFRGFSTVSDAFAYIYQEGGREFYVLTFPTDNQTWVYDITTSAQIGQHVWHERQSMAAGRHIGNCYMYFNRKHVIGDYASGKFYYMSDDYLDDDGALIQRTLVAQHFHNMNLTLFLDFLEIIMETGVGLITGNYTDPVITLEISRDGGHLWESYGTVPLGKIGQYWVPVFWEQLGQSRVFTIRLTIADPVRCFIMGGAAFYRAGKR